MQNGTAIPSLLQRQSISTDLIDYFKQQILSGELNPGDRLVETKIARELGISQKPIREALRQLQGEAIITIIPNKGSLVSKLDMKDAFEIYSFRAMLEGLAIRLATQHASDEEICKLEQFYSDMIECVHDEKVPVSHLLEYSFHIHDTIMRLSAHSRLCAMYKSISFQIALVNRSLGTSSSKMKELEQHWELIKALRSRNPDHAEDVMRRHIYKSYSDFVKINGSKNVVEYGEEIWLNRLLDDTSNKPI